MQIALILSLQCSVARLTLNTHDFIMHSIHKSSYYSRVVYIINNNISYDSRTRGYKLYESVIIILLF